MKRQFLINIEVVGGDIPDLGTRMEGRLWSVEAGGRVVNVEAHEFVQDFSPAFGTTVLCTPVGKPPVPASPAEGARFMNSSTGQVQVLLDGQWHDGGIVKNGEPGMLVGEVAAILSTQPALTGYVETLKPAPNGQGPHDWGQLVDPEAIERIVREAGERK